MQKMYPAVVNSPKTELVASITETDTEIEVTDASVLLQPEGLAVIGNGEGAETIRYTEVDGSILKGCIRGFQGTAKPWGAGARMARNFMAYDHDAFKTNIEQHDTAITSLTDRLDNADTDDVVLQPGLQVIDAAKDARFKLGQIVGKTEINGQGRTGLIGVESPYVINTAGNLLPPFYEWGNLTETVLIEPYEAVMSPTVANRVMSFKVPIAPGEVYTLSAEHNGNIALSIFDHNDGEISSSGYQQTSSVTVQADANVAYLRVYFSNLAATTGTFSFKNPILTIGTEPQSFQPQRKSMLAFQTELHANPTDGSEPDILFEQDGEYRKLAKWEKVIVSGSISGATYENPATYTGFKRVRIKNIDSPPPSVPVISYATKCDGAQLGPLASVADTFAMGFDSTNGTYVLFHISNLDSGWGDDVTPTQDEIKACVNGWKMAHLDGTTPYTAAGVSVHGAKAWIPALGFNGSNGANTLPTSASSAALAAGWNFYNLLFRLAKEKVEPVVTEGSLLLSEGDNMVEVGTGIVLRERANPYYHAPQNRYYINNLNFGTSLLNFKSSSIIAVYKDSTDDATWHVDATPGGGANLVQAYVDAWNSDQSAAYSVTYTKLDESPIQPIAGALAANEKAQISDLTAGVAEALHGVSVLAMKKAEKDAPGWITPTLLNGAVQGSTPVRYKKMPDGTVRFIGIFVPTAPSTVFKLLVGHRPKDILRIPIVSFRLDGTVFPSYAYIETNGEVAIGLVGDNYTSFDGVSFMAEQ